MSNLVAIVGGNLQGVEATYLAKKAGWQVLLIDKNPQAAASLMCDCFLPLTITTNDNPREILKQVTLIIPAMENDKVLRILEKWSLETGIPLAFDMAAYTISSSKKKSNQLFKEININTPKSWPQCTFPIVVKPDGESGSRGVEVIRNEKELASLFPDKACLKKMVTEKYLEGPSYSIEVIGFPGNYTPLQVTQLHMDNNYDCKRILTPSGLDSTRVIEFEQMAIRVAERIQLKGLMDLEVVLHEGQLKMLEIDARLPSQTPTAVFQSTGINMVKLLGELFLTGKINVNNTNRPQTVIYEHIKVIKDNIEVKGEHIMSGIGSLLLFQGLFGADEVITNSRPEIDEWVATLIFKGKNMEEVLDKKQKTYENIRNKAGQIAY
ncbi:MAG TPA: 3-methylornithine--L-lysine ligase PylC [Phycisphaerales bacterium]|nr:3-methylornithine--L-lysine ligase PylC [Phycisphaerales bacterium]